MLSIQTDPFITGTMLLTINVGETFTPEHGKDHTTIH